MRIHSTTIHTAAKRPVRQQPTTQPNFGPGVEVTSFGDRPVNSSKARKSPKHQPTPSSPPPTTPNNVLFQEGWAGPGPSPRPLQSGGTFTFDPNGPRAPLQLAPGAPGTSPAPNFGKAPAAWGLAATLVSEG